MTLRMSEVYLSTQGEGPRVGERTVFVRFAGCNLRCPGWPCDTQFAIDPKLYRHEWKWKPVADVYEEIKQHVKLGARTNVCFTGGEPFLQEHYDLCKLWNMLCETEDLGSIEAFTNGTILYPYWAVTNVAMVMDWKLPGSGEDYTNENRIKNLKNLAPAMIHSVKFVIANRHDFDIAMALYGEYKDLLDNFQVFYGVAWGLLKEAELVKWVLDAQLPWKLNVQVHNYVWPAHERAR